MDEDFKNIFFYVKKIFQKYEENNLRNIILDNFIKGVEIGCSNKTGNFIHFVETFKLNV